jgi:acyl-CoA oxidase
VQPGNGGSYVTKAKGFSAMAMIGQRLFSGRVAVAWAALTFTRTLYEMTHQYSDKKTCWGPKGNSNLTKVPQLGALYPRADAKLRHIESFVGECERRLSECLREGKIPPVELQEAIACAKIVASESCIDLCFRLKQDVGSYALMGDTGFEQMDFLQACKFAEGDSRILMQKLARDRVKLTGAVGSPKEQELAKTLQEAMKSGPTAWDENFETVYDLAWTVCERVVGALIPGDNKLSLPAGLSKM